MAVYLAWGTTYLAIRFAVETLPRFLMAGTRFLIAGALLYAYRRLAAGDPPPRRVEWRSALVVGSLLLAGGNGLVSWAEQRVASGVAALLVGSAPLWMVLIDALLPAGRARRPGWGAFAGVGLGLLGIALLVGPQQLAGNGLQVDPLGAGALLLAGFSWAVGSIAGREARLPASPLLATSMEMLAGSLSLLLIGALLGEWGRLELAAVSARSLLGLGYLVVFGSLVGFAAYTWLLRAAPTPLVATYAYVNPLVAILLGSLLAGEALSPRLLLAAGVILCSVALINSTRNRVGRVKKAQRELPELGEAR